MPDTEDEVVRHYGNSAIVERIMTSLAAQGIDTQSLRPEQLYPFDQLHGRQLAATREHVARLAPHAGMHILDVGSGVGGPARYIAATYRARVTGIDLTPQFVEAATELTRRSGLSETVDFVLGDATAMPFADASFDAALSFYVGMNIANKAAVAAEIYRVLKPGGLVLWSQAVAGAGYPRYPLPWAMKASVSHAGPESELHEAFAGAGFRDIEIEDETTLFPAPGGPPPPEGDHSVNQLVMGEDFVERRRNFVASLAEGSLRSVVLTARK